MENQNAESDRALPAHSAKSVAKTMTIEQACDEVARLKGLFPGTTKEQEDFWFGEFVKYPPDVVRRAIDRFAHGHGDFVDRPGLITAIKEQVPKAAAVPGEALSMDQARATYERKRKAELEAADATFEAINAALADLDDAALETLKARVIEAESIYNPFLSKILTRADPKSSRTLRCLMSKLLSNQQDL